MEHIKKFLAYEAFEIIKKHWKAWAEAVGAKKWIIGISGGIDSTCVAALACRIFGRNNVIGVSLPCDGQADMLDVDFTFNHLGIYRITIDIGDMVAVVKNGIENNCLPMSEQASTNLPARLRMATLYAVAQSYPVGGIVLNTCNLSESVLGNDTLFGDDCGSYAPIQELTKTEVRALATWLNVPLFLVNKVPVDGLQPLSDEDRLGLKYEDVDKVIRGGDPVDIAIAVDVMEKYQKNKFKLSMVRIAGPSFGYPDFVQEKNIA